MRTHAGVWIDHRKAVIVLIEGHNETTRIVESDVEKHVRYSASAHSVREGQGEASHERRFAGELSRYYDEVVEHLIGAETLLIMGPGEAKSELRTRLEREGIGNRIAGFETVDKLTVPQIAARVRECFVT